MRTRDIFISCGSNIGDKRRNLDRGIATLGDCAGCDVVATSKFYRTEPVDYLDQDWFINAVVKIETDETPHELLTRLKRIEAAIGRTVSAIRYGPRVLDMDIVLFGRLVLESPTLTIPHRRLHKRRFVLKPICDIDPDILHPVLNQPLKSLLAALNTEGQGLEPIL